MEPVTHLLTGACLARSGFHRRIAYAVAAMTVAAEFPDVDAVWSLQGSVPGFEHARGMTHTFVGIPVEAALLLCGFFVLQRWRSRNPALRRSGQEALRVNRAAARNSPPAPARWGALYGLICLALLSHLLLDYTDNYGLRPFFPFNGRWYAGSIVSVFDPLLSVMLAAGLLLPGLFGLVNREVGASERSVSPGWARAALAGVLCLWALRTVEHGRALDLAQQTTVRAPAQEQSQPVTPVEAQDAEIPGPEKVTPATTEARPLLQARRSLASPDPLSVFRWYVVTDYGPVYRLGIADSRRSVLDAGRRLVSSENTKILDAAKRSRLGRDYMDWSPLPYLTVEEGSESSQGQAGQDQVRFEDPRYMEDTLWHHQGDLPPFTAGFLVEETGKVITEGMNGRFGR